jgi:hypothetical protein
MPDRPACRYATPSADYLAYPCGDKACLACECEELRAEVDRQTAIAAAMQAAKCESDRRGWEAMVAASAATKRVGDLEDAQQQGHATPCTFGPLCPYCEIDRLKAMSTVEMMGENLNVNHHITEWEARCLKAESQLAAEVAAQKAAAATAAAQAAATAQAYAAAAVTGDGGGGGDDGLATGALRLKVKLARGQADGGGGQGGVEFQGAIMSPASVDLGTSRSGRKRKLPQLPGAADEVVYALPFGTASKRGRPQDEDAGEPAHGADHQDGPSPPAADDVAPHLQWQQLTAAL